MTGLLKKSNQRAGKTYSSWGVEVFLTVEDALRIDRKNDNTLWNNSIGKEMKISRVAFNFIDRNDHAPVSYKQITCHLIFDVKIDLTSKARYVSGGNITESSFVHNLYKCVQS